MLNSRHWVYEVAVLAMVCVLSMFFLPLAHGPYSAVHGPITALRSLRNKLQLVFSMWRAALRIFAAALLRQGSASARFWPAPVFAFSGIPPESKPVLRC